MQKKESKPVIHEAVTICKDRGAFFVDRWWPGLFEDNSHAAWVIERTADRIWYEVELEIQKKREKKQE